MKFISILSINKRVNLCTYMYIGSIWWTCVLSLQPYRDITPVLFFQIGQCGYFITVFNNIHAIREFTDNRVNRHIVDVLHVHLHVAAVPCYNMCIALQIVDILLVYNNILTLSGWNSRQSTHCLCDIYMHLLTFIYRVKVS